MTDAEKIKILTDALEYYAVTHDNECAANLIHEKNCDCYMPNTAIKALAKIRGEE